MAYSGGAGLPGHGPGPGPGGARAPKPMPGMKAGPHGAIYAPSGPNKPVAKPGFMTIGVGSGRWIEKPVAAPKPAGGGGKGGGKGGGGGGKFAGPGVALNNPILDPSKPLSGQSLYDAAKALADAQTKGPLAELANQISQNNRQTKGAINQTGGYLNSLGNFAKQGVADEQKIAGNLNLGLGIIGAGEQQGLQGIGQNAQAQLSKYTPQSSPGDTSTQAPAMQALTQELARQQGLASQQQGTFKAGGATQGANYAGLAASNLGTDALAGTQTLKGIAQAGEVKNQPLNAKSAALRAQEGALLGTDLGRLRQQEVANKFTSQGLGLKQQGLALTAVQDAAKNALTAQGLSITQQNNLANQAQRAAALNEKTGNDAATQAYRQAALNLKAAGKAGGGAKPLTTSQQNTLYRNLGEMQTLIGTAQKAGHSEAQIRQALQTGSLQKGFGAQSSVLVEAAYELLGYGSIDKSTAAAMHAMGLRGGTFRGRPIRVTPNFHAGPPPGPSGPGGATG